MKLLSCLLAVSLTCSSAAQASLSSAERRMAQIPEIAIARGDIRTLSLEQEARVRAWMRQIVAKQLPDTEVEASLR